MPYLDVRTNVALQAEEKRLLLREASRTVADLLGKPESYVMVQVTADQDMVFGGTDEPLCLLSLRSLGLPEERTTELSKALCTLVEQHIHVPPQRVYIEFVSPPRHMWGYNGGTFA